MNRQRHRYIDDKNDYTFLFDIRDHYIKVVITNNDTECDVAVADLIGGAREFYSQKYDELSYKTAIGRIRSILRKENVGA